MHLPMFVATRMSESMRCMRSRGKPRRKSRSRSECFNRPFPPPTFWCARAMHTGFSPPIQCDLIVCDDMMLHINIRGLLLAA